MCLFFNYYYYDCYYYFNARHQIPPRGFNQIKHVLSDKTAN